MFHYAITLDGSNAWGEMLFTNKKEALKAFDRAFVFGGTVSLYQGAFKRDAHGSVSQFGRSFRLMREWFDEDGQVY